MVTRKSRSVKAKLSGNERASWKGDFSFGLVSFAVEAFNALDRREGDIHFNQLHSVCHSRIRYQKVCPVHGVVENDEIVSGYEHKKGKYVEIDPEELAALRSEQERALTIDAFISEETVDPLYFDGRMYYLLPATSGAEESYRVVVSAMEREERCAVGRIVFSGKDQIVLIRPLQNIMHMAMLNYDAEIRPPEKVAAALKKSTGNSRQVRLAQTLVREWSDDDFDFSAYQDSYREKLEKMIEAKLKGNEIVAPEEEERPATLNLMEALKKSLNQSRPSPGRRRKSARKRA